MNNEIAHYVVTAHPPGGVLVTAKCNFMSPHSSDIIVAKSRRLEIRQLRPSESESQSPFPIVLSAPINGRITSLLPLQLPGSMTSYLFMTTDQFAYAVVSYDAKASPYPFVTHASGSLKGEDHNSLGKQAECAPLVCVDPHSRCIALHLYDGLLTLLPIHTHYQPSAAVKGQPRLARGRSILAEPFHPRLEERTVLQIAFLHTSQADLPPQICLLHQDARGAQHVVSHMVDLRKRQLVPYGSPSASGQQQQWLKKSRIDGGSSLLIALPPPQVTQVAAAATTSAATATPSPKTGGIVILGQRQITFVSTGVTKVMPIHPALVLSWEDLPPDASGMPRFLLGDEFGNLHILTVMAVGDKVAALQLDTLGSCNLASSLRYLGEGLVYVGSTFGDAQLIQIHDEPIPLGEQEQVELAETSYLTVVEEYTHLGPILDFDLVPTAPGMPSGVSINANNNSVAQSQVVTASGSSKSGSIRLVRNGIGMNEYASVEIPGIQDMWSVRRSFSDKEDSFLVQSFVGETRVLGVTSTSALPHDGDGDQTMQEDDVGGTLEEVFIPGLDSTSSTLYVANVQAGDRLVQITESEIRLVSLEACVDRWTPSPEDVVDHDGRPITVASANEAGQVAVALRGGLVLCFVIRDDNIELLHKKMMSREVSCLDLRPFSSAGRNSMDIDSETKKAASSSMVAVGLWDDFTVRLLSLDESLNEILQINLSTEDEEEDLDDAASPGRRNRHNMMARSLCLITLDYSSSTNGGNTANSSGVDMLFVGLGDGTLVSFAVVMRECHVTVQSKKEVSLGTQRINLVPLQTERGGTCVLATGDRPTVIYLAGLGGASVNNYTPKLCYSNVNLSAAEDDDDDDVSRPPAEQSIAVNVAAPFFSPLLFDPASLGNEHYSLCVADDSNLRLGVIDDIQKLHVTTCRLGMAPRRIVHCAEGRMFAVGCIESGIQQSGMGLDESNMGNCIRFLDDTTFDDIERIDLEPFEMVLSMIYAQLRVYKPMSAEEPAGSTASEAQSGAYHSYLLVGTAFALPDEDEPTRGRILVYSCGANCTDGTGSGSHEATATSSSATGRSVRLITEHQVRGGVYSMCQFFHGRVLATVNSKTQICQLVDGGTSGGVVKLNFVGVGHHGHILSLFVKSRAYPARTPPAGEPHNNARQPQSEHASLPEGTQKESKNVRPEGAKEMLAIVGDLMRSISLVQFYPEHETLEEVARDFHANWCTAVEMLTDDVYVGAENWNNLFVLRRNVKAQSEEIRCRLETVGEFHLGEMCNKFMRGSLIMPNSNNSSNSTRGVAGTPAARRAPSGSPTKKSSGASLSKTPATAVRTRRPNVTIGSQTLFATVDGTLGSILGLDSRTAAFFITLERAMIRVIKPVGDFSHQLFRAFNADQRVHPSHGFVDGDLVESFLDLDRKNMELVVGEMNRDGGWELDDTGGSSTAEEGGMDSTPQPPENRPELSVDDVLAMVEEMTMVH